MKKIVLSIGILLGISSITTAQISIASARSMAVGSTVTVRGIVLNGSELGDVRYMQDNTGNIAAFNTVLLDGVNRGDSIEVTGATSDYNALLEISVTSVSVINTGNTLPIASIYSTVTGWAEANEGKLVQVTGATFETAGSFSTAGSGSNYTIDDAAGTAQIRVLTATNIDGTPIPTDAVSITGVMSQYAPGGVGGYQLLPRDLFDISTGGNPPVISTSLSQTNITTSSFTVGFATLNPGNTIINYGTTTALGTLSTSATLETTHSTNLTGLTPGTIYYVQAASVSATNDTSYSAIATMATVSNSSGVIRIWFNHPADNSVSTGTNADYIGESLDDTIKYYIDHAKYSLDIAIYNVDNDNGIITSINDAYARGVTVRVICDAGVNTDAYNALNIGFGNKKLSPVGTALNGDFYGINHNKFIIIDAVSTEANDPWVLTGSANFTDQQLKLDVQNYMAIQDMSLAKAYTLEFNEMFGGTFGPDKKNNTPHDFMINTKYVELYFSPSDNTETHLIEQINNADHDLYFGVYSYTRYGISYAISDAIQDNGVFAAGIIDDIDTTATEYTVLEDVMPSTLFLHNGGYLFHDKYLLVDPTCPQADPVIFTGSHNWTSSANSRNDENSIIIHDSTIANIYYQDFVQRYKDEGGSIFVSGDCNYTPVVTIPENNMAITVYPNPSKGIFGIKINSSIQESVQCIISDITGKIIYSENKNIHSGSNVISVTMENISAGMYILQLYGSDIHESERLVIGN